MSIMALQFRLAAALLLLSAATTRKTSAAAQALPGCSDKCGDLTVPYPFGMEEGCYLGKEFFINCSRTTQPPTAYLAKGHLVVTNISLELGELRTLNYISTDCYDSQGNRTFYFRSWLDLPRQLPYTVSDSKNKFYAVGCDTSATMRGFRGELEVITGCISKCNSLSTVDNFCSGIGCCQINIPSGLNNVSVELASYNNHLDVWTFNPCSYAFIEEQGLFNFKSFNSGFKKPDTSKPLPVILNWAIGNEPDPCDQAENRKDVACKANSECVNRANGSAGYLCRCLPGFEGNPYHPDGCKDIDDCEASNPCLNGECVNLLFPQNYSCACHEGYKKDKTNDKSCIKNHSSKIVLLLVVSLGTSCTLGLYLVISALWLVKVIKKRETKRRKEKCFKQNGGLVLQQQLSSGDQANVEKIKLFNSRELEKATDYFSSDRILGQGGQGTVYKGMLTDGQIVAVKKSKIVNGGEVGQFINEIVILSQINHRNVVKLLGCCLETEIPLLVYEYLPNGTLSQYIHDPDDEFPLTWGTRLRVSAQVAGALSYLHSAASIPIYHRDIKCTNILLDAKYRAKIADFGTSRSVSVDQTHLTTLVHGTLGYLDPEYLQSNQFTEKSDVYSFGVVLAELLTGQKPVSIMRPHECRSLATHFLLSMKQNRLFDILDPQVMKDGSKEEIIAVANLAQRCLNLNGRKRPTMREVAAKLERVRLAAKDADHVQQNLVEEGDVGTHEIHTMDYCDVVSMSTTGPFTDGGTADSSFDVQPLLFYKTQ